MLESIIEFLKGLGLSCAIYGAGYVVGELASRSEAEEFMLLLLFMGIFYIVCTVCIIAYSVATFKDQPSKSLGRARPAIGVFIWGISMLRH